MAKEQDDQAVVEVPEEGVVEIQLDGAEGTEPEKKPEPKVETKKEPLPRVRIKDPPAADPDKVRADLEASVATERRLRQQAEATATAATQEAQRLARENTSRAAQLLTARENQEAAQLQTLETGIANATSQIDSAKKEVAAAMTEGNFEKVAEAQTKLSKASATLDRLEATKEDFVAGKATRDAAAEATTTDEGATTIVPSPIEQYVAKMAPKSQQWLRDHPDYAPTSFGGDDAKNAKMLRGHYDALSQGYAANSDDYFRVIEESTGIRQAAAQEQEEDVDEETEKPAPKKKTAAPQQREARPSAPPTRNPPGSPQGGQSRTVRLTQAEQEAARISFPHLDVNKAYAEYAKNKVQLDAEGKLGRTSH
jgi:hypothetical protein